MTKYLFFGITLILTIETIAGTSSTNASATAFASDSAGISFSFVFDTSNSDDKDPVEAKMFYPPKRTERLLPPSCGLKVAPCTGSPYRRLDGSCTNDLHPSWGVPNNTYSRLLPAKYATGFRQPRKGNYGYPLPSARLVRTSLFLTGEAENKIWTINAMQWGQFIAHDMSHLKEPERAIKCCSADSKVQKNCGRYCFPIKVPLNDTTMGKAGIMCMNFTRTVTDKDMRCSKGLQAPQQINVVTSFLDLSNVYGLNKEMSDKLRTMQCGMLKVDMINNRAYPPREVNVKGHCPCNQPGESACYMTGDSRSNQNPQLTILQTIFVREHNRIAKELSKINPYWLDEKLFQESRRIMIAVFQHITYYEWLPIFLDIRVRLHMFWTPVSAWDPSGRDNLLKNNIIFANPGYVNDYNSNVNPAVSNEHAHGAYRYFHTNIVGMLRLLDRNRNTQSTVPINNWFNRPQILETGDNIEQLTMGMVTQNLEETDDFFVEQITDKLFTCPGDKFGIDLRATDFQRDRDHGLAYYNDYRKYCGLKEAKSFDDFEDLIEKKNIEIMKTLYKSYKDVDMSVGGSLESLAPGAQAGPTFVCIMNDQFKRTRQSDKFFFENTQSGFNQAQLNEIRKSTVARMFCDSGDGITDIQPRAFTLIFPGFNRVAPCSTIPSMNLSAWKEY